MKILPPPGRARNQQLALLAIVLLAGVYVITRLSGGAAPAAGVSPAKPAAGSPAASNTTRTPPVSPPARSEGGQKIMPEPVELDKLQSNTEPSDTSRNPFRFGSRPAPPPPPPSSAKVQPVAPPPPPGPPPPPPIPAIPLRFIGRMVVDKQIVAVLSDTKGSVFRAIEGQVVDGRYRVVKIGEESLVIEYVNGTGRTTLPLRGR
jgi:hypothetical protein